LDGTDTPKYTREVKHYTYVYVTCAFVWLYKWIL